jgi:hypothetical protein
MAKKRKTPFGPEVEENEPAGGAPKPPEVVGTFDVSAIGIISGTGRATFEKLWGKRPTNEELRAKGYSNRQGDVIQGEWDDSYAHFVEAGLPPGMTEFQYLQVARVYGSNYPWATTGLPQFAAVQHVSRKSGRGELRWISKFPDAYVPDDTREPVPYWEGPGAKFVLNPHNTISTFQIYLTRQLGIDIPDANLHPWCRQLANEEDDE